jgi:hypothetical protein
MIESDCRSQLGKAPDLEALVHRNSKAGIGLYASFWRAMAQMGALGQEKAELPRRPKTIAAALSNDWKAVRSDLRRAERTYAEKMRRAG